MRKAKKENQQENWIPLKNHSLYIARENNREYSNTVHIWSVSNKNSDIVGRAYVTNFWWSSKLNSTQITCRIYSTIIVYFYLARFGECFERSRWLIPRLLDRFGISASKWENCSCIALFIWPNNSKRMIHFDNEKVTVCTPISTHRID